MYDYLIVGAGIVGMAVAYELTHRNPSLKVAIVEKESDVAQHASGRNSGVLHAGFYYSADSLKARFTQKGNQLMRQFCKENGININETRKVVIAQNANELSSLYELAKRGKMNGVAVEIIDIERLRDLDPNVKTFEKALYSPTTASVDPKEVCQTLKAVLQHRDVRFYFNMPFEKWHGEYHYLINCAGLYADKVAHHFGLAKDYTILPFKGIYMKYTGSSKPIKTNVYPVPNMSNPFLGVHYTVTSKNEVKIGPTAIPAFWRENYYGLHRFKLLEMLEIVLLEAKLFFVNAFGFRNLAINEMKNYNKTTFVKKAKNMLYRIDNAFIPMPAGIRAQLLNTKTNELVMDFVVEHITGSTHVLNAVSPAFTCAFAFAEYVVDEIEINRSANNG